MGNYDLKSITYSSEWSQEFPLYRRDDENGDGESQDVEEKDESSFYPSRQNTPAKPPDPADAEAITAIIRPVDPDLSESTSVGYADAGDYKMIVASEFSVSKFDEVYVDGDWYRCVAPETDTINEYTVFKLKLEKHDN